MCDIYVEFIEDTLEQCEEGILKIDEMYHAFRIWYKDSFDTKCPSKKEFKDGVAKKLGKYHLGRNSGWHGWRFLVELDGEPAEIEEDKDFQDSENGSLSGQEQEQDASMVTSTVSINSSSGKEAVNSKKTGPKVLPKMLPKIVKKEQLASN